MAEAQVASSFNPAELIKRVEDTEKRLQTKDAEIQVYKMLMAQMEEELAQAKKVKAAQEKQVQDVDFIKAESEKTLTKAKSLIFERTKIIKNQELQIEAFVQQIDSLKEVVRITKDLLEIRNLEIKQLEIKISAIEGKVKCEKERYDLMHKKLEQMIRHNGELKREYETQLCLFSALRERYNERELAKNLVDELKQDVKTTNTIQENETTINNSDETSQINDLEGEQNVINNENPELESKEDTADEKENEVKQVELCSIVDAKNRLDNIVSVLENTLGLNTSDADKDRNENEKQDESKDNLATTATLSPESSTVTEVSDTNEIEINENKTQAEANSTLDNIISALKNTIGLGSVVSDPVPENKPDEETSSQVVDNTSPEIVAKKD